MSLLTLNLAKEVNLKLCYNGEHEGNMTENDEKHLAFINT